MGTAFVEQVYNCMEYGELATECYNAMEFIPEDKPTLQKLGRDIQNREKTERSKEHLHLK